MPAKAAPTTVGPREEQGLRHQLGSNVAVCHGTFADGHNSISVTFPYNRHEDGGIHAPKFAVQALFRMITSQKKSAVYHDHDLT